MPCIALVPVRPGGGRMELCTGTLLNAQPLSKLCEEGGQGCWPGGTVVFPSWHDTANTEEQMRNKECSEVTPETRLSHQVYVTQGSTQSPDWRG